MLFYLFFVCLLYFKASFLLGNAKFNIGYLEENNHIGNNSYFKSDIKLEINEFGKCFETKELKEGTSAFLNKRKPDFN